MEVTLRIVGLFFNKKVTIDASVKTVKDVMDAYRGSTRRRISDPEGLTYTIESHDNSIKRISYNFNGNFDFEGDIPANGSGRSLGDKVLPARVYTLAERKLGPNAQLAWQYYVINRNGINKSRTVQSGRFTAFGQNPADYTIADGDTIYWRLVAINLPKTVH